MVKRALQSIETGHSDTVPLNEALKRGFLALAPNASSSADAVLVILAVGPDTCPGGGNLEKILNDLRMANPTLHVRSPALRLSPFDPFRRRCVHRDGPRRVAGTGKLVPFRLGDAPTVVLLANNEEQLRDRYQPRQAETAEELLQISYSLIGFPLAQIRPSAHTFEAEGSVSVPGAAMSLSAITGRFGEHHLAGNNDRHCKPRAGKVDNEIKHRRMSRRQRHLKQLNSAAKQQG